MARRRDRAQLTVLVIVEVTAVVALHRLGSIDGLGVPWGSVADWVRTAPTEEVVGALVRVGALALAWWLLVSTLLCIAAAGVRDAPRAARTLSAAALPSVRRLVQRAVATSALAAAVIGARPALAAPPPPTAPGSAPEVAIDHRGPRPAPPSTTPPAGRTGRSGGLESVPAPAVPTTTPAPAPTPADPGPPSVPPPSVVPPAIGASYVVAPGDSLWSIAATQLARLSGRAPADVADTEVAPYWVAVVAANRDRLRSGDPNLIYPGEELELPPLA